MTNDTLLLINAIITLFIGVVLLLIVRHLSLLRTTVEKSQLVTSQAQGSAFDQLLMHEPAVRDLLHYSQWEALSLVVLHDMEARYLRWKAGISDGATWQADQAFIKKYARTDFVRAMLQSSAQEFRPDFITFLAGKSSS